MEPSHSKNVEPILSIITITKDDLQGLKKTRESVLRQVNTKSIEHIVVDGSEGDETKAYLNKQTGENLIFVSDVDSGIYQAMNAGIRFSRGKILMWVNSGDTLHNSKSLSLLLNHIPPNFQGWGYGVTVVFDDKNNFKAFAGSEKINFLSHLLGEAFFPHPSSFFSSTIVKKVGQYDEHIGLVADQIFMMTALKFAYPLFINFPVADFVDNGASSKLSRKDARSQLAKGAIKYRLISKKVFLPWLIGRMVLSTKEAIKSFFRLLV